MKNHDLLREAGNRVSRCDRCGACLPVCPLYGVKGIEATSARGKNTIARALADGGLEPTRELLDTVNFCLLCRACVDTCPAKVPTDEAMVDVRQHLTDLAGGADGKYRLIGGLLKRPVVVKTAAAALSILRRSGLNGLFPHGMAPEEYTRSHFLTAFAGPAALGGQAPPAPAVRAQSDSEVVRIVRELGLPVKLLGVGERVEDLQAFDPTAFVDALVPAP